MRSMLRRQAFKRAVAAMQRIPLTTKSSSPREANGAKPRGVHRDERDDRIVDDHIGKADRALRCERQAISRIPWCLMLPMRASIGATTGELFRAL